LAVRAEYVGKRNFYLSAGDDLLRHPDDQPSIGLILCKTRNQIVAEYALRDLAKPVGVARYVTRPPSRAPYLPHATSRPNSAKQRTSGASKEPRVEHDR
jgi:hypothetical protein